MQALKKISRRFLDLAKPGESDLDTTGTGAAFLPPAPGFAFMAIGDVHGCETLLDSLVRRIDHAHGALPLVFTGDLIDRGENSAGVLRRLMILRDRRPGAVHVVMGNHERMLLDFLDHPARMGPAWLKSGGLQTLASYRLDGSGAARSSAQLETLARTFRQRLGTQTLAWLRDLPLHWSTGNVHVVHAGANPTIAPDQQSAEDLLWGHADFGRVTRQDDQWVIAGHHIQPDVRIDSGVVQLDTGAYATGRLSAIRVDSGKIEIL